MRSLTKWNLQKWSHQVLSRQGWKSYCSTLMSTSRQPSKWKLPLTLWRTGRIGIHEGDEPKELTKNFCRVFCLKSQDMQVKLLKHLEQSISNFNSTKTGNKFKLPDQLNYMVSDSSQDLKPTELELRLDLLGPSSYSIASPMNSRTEFSNLNSSLID